MNKRDITYVMMRAEPSMLPYYAPPLDESRKRGNEWIEECLFLPITTEEFMTDRTHHHYGYRLQFHSSGQTSLGVGCDGSLTHGMTYLQMNLDVNRIRFHMKDTDGIVIDRICDPLTPPREFKYQIPTEHIGDVVTGHMYAIINELCAWYEDKHI
jgi:hypothetical protein